MEQGRGRRQFGRFQGLKLFLKAAALARYGFGIADIAFDAVGVGAHHRNPAERQRKLETIPAFEDLAPFHEQTDGHDGRIRTGGEELLGRCELYTRLYNMQFRAHENICGCETDLVES